MTDATTQAPAIHPEHSIQVLMAKILSELPAIGKTGFNKSQGYSFRGVDGILKELNPLLSKYGVLTLPEVLDRELEKRETAKGGVNHVTHLKVRYSFVGPQGDRLTVTVWGEGADSGDKSTQKALTSAYKYALVQAFAISEEEANAADIDHYTQEPTVARNPADKSEIDALKHQANELSGPKRAALKRRWWEVNIKSLDGLQADQVETAWKVLTEVAEAPEPEPEQPAEEQPELPVQPVADEVGEA